MTTVASVGSEGQLPSPPAHPGGDPPLLHYIYCAGPDASSAHTHSVGELSGSGACRALIQGEHASAPHCHDPRPGRFVTRGLYFCGGGGGGGGCPGRGAAGGEGGSRGGGPPPLWLRPPWGHKTVALAWRGHVL
eukprot:gene8335-biopygen3121